MNSLRPWWMQQRVNAPPVLSYRDEVLLDGPLVYHRFGEIGVAPFPSADNIGTLGASADATYNHPNFVLGTAGSLISDPDTAVTCQASVFSEGIDFDGVTGFPVGGLGDCTIEVWVKPNAGPTSYETLFAGISGGFDGIYLRSSGALEFYRGGTQLNGGTWTVGVWNHIVFTRLGNVGTFYVNGVLAVTGIVTTGLIRTGSGAFSGLYSWSSDGSSTEHYLGVMDEGIIYDYDIGAARVLDHYNANV